MLGPPDALVHGVVPFVDGFLARGRHVALIAGDRRVTYAELDDLVESSVAQLGRRRRLVLVAGANRLGAIVTYVAALRAGHVVLLAPDEPDRVAGLVAAWNPDVVAVGDDEQSLLQRGRGSAHELHADLALLLSTSGTTGSSKLVRLSSRSVASNAAAIAQYLELTEDDRAITTLPMHYCYGLSVINSYLHRGATLILNELSVTAPCFWKEFQAHRATSLAGVPYTFDLLDRVGFESMSLSSLRYVTQAGGRLAPTSVRRFAAQGERDGWRLFVMYGQTEATARMAYLPPDLASVSPGAIGIPIPGGSFTIEPLPDSAPGDPGELIYHGPNVMLGYAESPADLARGRDVSELRTGDLARRIEGGLYEVVGRRARFVKLFGLRVDLDQVERLCEARMVPALCAGDDDRLVIAVPPGPDRAELRCAVADSLGLPHRVVTVVEQDEIPRLANGKPDYGAILRRSPTPSAHLDETGATEDSLRRLYASILQCEPTADSSFTSLGGDSLSYVELSVRLEHLIGQLPDNWHNVPIRALGAPAGPEATGRARDTSVVLRAVGITLIVGTHVRLFTLLGGAHVLLAVAGYNFARFQLTAASRRETITRQLRAAARIALPAMCWIGLLASLGIDYTPANALLVNHLLGSTVWDERWRYWFIETLVFILVAVALFFAVPGVRAFERRHGLTFAVLLFAVTLVPRFEVGGFGAITHNLYQPETIAWVFVLGWLIERARTTGQKLAATIATVVCVVGYFDEPGRDAVLIVGALMLLWLPTLRLPSPLSRLIAPIAASSLLIYLTHPQVYPFVLDRSSPVAALTASLVAGLLAAGVATYVTSVAERGVANLAERWPRPHRRPRLSDVKPLSASHGAPT